MRLRQAPRRELSGASGASGASGGSGASCAPTCGRIRGRFEVSDQTVQRFERPARGVIGVIIFLRIDEASTSRVEKVIHDFDLRCAGDPRESSTLWVEMSSKAFR